MRAFFIALTLALVACTPAAETPAPQTEAPAGHLEVRDAWAAPTPGGVNVSAGYLTIINGYGTDELLAMTKRDLFPIFAKIPLFQHVGPLGSFTKPGNG